MEHIAELIRGRRSVRTFDGKGIGDKQLKKLSAFMAEIENPYGIPVTFKLLNAREHDLKCPVVTGTDLYVGAKAPRGRHTEEAIGYSFEMLVLYAWSMGIGTVWIGGTMGRAAFERAMILGRDEMMPCISPLGYPAKKPSLRESMMRRAVKADGREPFQGLFFHGGFDVPLTVEAAGRLTGPLEAVRLAPSAVNKQPWRVVVSGNAVHFYLKRSKGFIGEATGDLQKIDLGIALCHFALAAQDSGIDLCFDMNDPGLRTDADMEYMASYLLDEEKDNTEAF